MKTTASKVPLVWIGIACVVCGYVLPYHTNPISTLHAEVSAAWGWLVLAGVWGQWRLPSWSRKEHLLLWLTIAMPALPIAINTLTGRTPNTAVGALGLCYVAFAVLVTQAGLRLGHALKDPSEKIQHAALNMLRLLAWAFVVAATLNAMAGVIQFMNWRTAWLDFIPSLRDAGRVYGLMRLPNFYGMVLLLGVIAVWGLLWSNTNFKSDSQSGSDEKRLRRTALALLSLGLGVAAALSSSKLIFGMFVLLGIAAAVSQTLPTKGKLLAIGVSLGHVATWAWLSHVANTGGLEFFGTARLLTPLADPTGSRIELWSEVLMVIKEAPWFGAGFGRLNQAHFTTDLPHRLTLDLTHAHNLPLHFAAEFGVPFVSIWFLIVSSGLVLWCRGLGSKWHRAWPLFAVLVVLAADGLVDWPFWYTYFLAPTACALGILVGLGAENAAAREIAVFDTTTSWKSSFVGMLLAMFVVWDYNYVSPLFRSGGGDVMKKIENGYKSVFFGHYVDYGVVINTPVTRDNFLQHESLSLKVSRFRSDQRVTEALLKASLWKGDYASALKISNKLSQVGPNWAHDFQKKLVDADLITSFNSHIISK